MSNIIIFIHFASARRHPVNIHSALLIQSDILLLRDNLLSIVLFKNNNNRDHQNNAPAIMSHIWVDKGSPINSKRLTVHLLIAITLTNGREKVV